MSFLKGKRILIISPQAWGKMHVSKHHYATELANFGNEVYFLNPPSLNGRKQVGLEKSEKVKGLYIINHRLWFPYNLKFHAINLFHILMKFQIRKILAAIGHPVDLIWSFDLGNIYPFRYFPDGSIKIFYPVDEPLNKTAIHSANGAQVIFSVTTEILEKYRQFQLPSFFINHGVSRIFLDQQSLPDNDGKVHIGLSGNLLRNDLDRQTLLQIIEENPSCIFEMWGSYTFKEANLGGEEDEKTVQFVNSLLSYGNVWLHGAVKTDELANGLARMDAFLIVYDINKDQSKGTNYHKIMEYLAIGKVIIANNITTYQGKDNLVVMNDSRTDNVQLPSLFKHVINQLGSYNSPEMIASRKQYASDNTYSAQIGKIDRIIDELFGSSDQ